jgi:hypothetical protein
MDETIKVDLLTIDPAVEKRQCQRLHRLSLAKSVSQRCLCRL